MVMISVLTVLSMVPLIYYFHAVRRRMG
jgi:hypothetical protein